MTGLAFNPNARIDLRRMGREGHPLVIIDDALLEPQALVDMACRTVFAAPPGGFYPGRNAPLPQDYVSDLALAVRPILAGIFALPEDQDIDLSGYFGLATQAPADLQPMQKIPHIDATDPRQIAMVHYLAHGPQGGTGFYRQDATGFEGVHVGRHGEYTRAYRQQLETAGDTLTRHVGPHTPSYSLIDTADAVFNRLILYRSTSLHSGLLETSNLSTDPASGRLTANVFVRPKTLAV